MQCCRKVWNNRTSSYKFISRFIILVSNLIIKCTFQCPTSQQSKKHRVIITQPTLFGFCSYQSSVLFENTVLIVVREKNIIV